ncbi:ultrapetala 1-like protein [Tanacetum coccineum]
MADGTMMMFSEEEVKEMCGFKFCGDGHVEVTCGCTSYCYGDAVGILKVFVNGDLEITCDCTPGCQEDKLTPAAFEKHSGRETARKWKNNIWVIVDGDKVPLYKTALLKYYNQALTKASNKSQSGQLVHRDEFVKCTKCDKLRRITCDDEEERASRRVYRGCSRTSTCTVLAAITDSTESDFRIREVDSDIEVIDDRPRAWCQREQDNRRANGRRPVDTWMRMKPMIKARFLPSDIKQILYQQYHTCVQGKRTVADYAGEFLRLQARCNLRETKEQSATMYISGLNSSLQERLSLTPIWSVDQAQNMAMKAERMSSKTRVGFKRLNMESSNNYGSRPNQIQYTIPGTTTATSSSKASGSGVDKNKESQLINSNLVFDQQSGNDGLIIDVRVAKTSQEILQSPRQCT